MTDANAYTVDELAQPMLLSSVGQQVMMAWEKKYMEQCVSALQITQDCEVLEIGFGLGFSATKIQTCKPKSYTIIECDPVVLARVRAWAEAYDNVRIIAGTWQTQLAALPEYDCIFFDDYPLPQNERDDANYTISRWYDFLDAVLNWHTKLHGRITGYLARPLDLTRPGCSVSLTPVQVDVPANCTYFPYAQALVPLVVLVERKPPQVTVYTLPTKGSGPRAASHPQLIAIRRQLDEQRHREAIETHDVAPVSPPSSRISTLNALRAAKRRKLLEK
ncbi:hypothetical protein ACHHYP_00500 [Achlya hypogyna]|uniref:Guanidinoacetate N-methyltransferase n=1 Tax=Achlya hypogyna TaxID=1202772 RepID=A0A1V9ZAL4_ACHHY|nr:hypothetical protein ACHHYP_00500 [Achlya hypogyna]